MGERRTVGWKPTCDCGEIEAVPAVVLDPFCGAGTTGLAACGLGRNFLGIEPNVECAEMAGKRIRGASPLFANVEVSHA